MAGKNDKWVLFKNYMHNELGIPKKTSESGLMMQFVKK